MVGSHLVLVRYTLPFERLPHTLPEQPLGCSTSAYPDVTEEGKTIQTYHTADTGQQYKASQKTPSLHPSAPTDHHTKYLHQVLIFNIVTSLDDFGCMKKPRVSFSLFKS